MKVTATRNGIIAGVVVLFAALMLTSVIHAQPGSRSQDGRGMGGGPRGMLPGLRDLELTDVQREAIRDIAEQDRSEGSAMAEQLGAACAALNEVVMDDVVNESMIRMHDQGERRRSALPRRWGDAESLLSNAESAKNAARAECRGHFIFIPSRSTPASLTGCRSRQSFGKGSSVVSSCSTISRRCSVKREQSAAPKHS